MEYGKVWKFGHNITTDHITPARLNTRPDLHNIVFYYHKPEYRKEVHAGDYVVGGRNFGAGSSRETAAKAIKMSGVEVVLAIYFARIFKDNCVDNGLYPIVIPEKFYDLVTEGNKIHVDVDTGHITYCVNELNDFIHGELPSKTSLKIIKAGDITNYLASENKEERKERWRF